MSAATLHEIARRIAACPPTDADCQASLLEEIRGIRKSWKNRTGTQLGGCLDGVIVMLTFLGELPAAAADEALQICARLVGLTAESFAASGDAEADPKGPPRFAPASLGMEPTQPSDDDSDLMLGQVLVTLRFATPDDIQRALAHQRSTGVRLGQALVQLGAVEASHIQEALDVQARMRDAGGLKALRLTTDSDSAETKESGLRLVSDAFLGDILIRKGYIDKNALEQGFMVQRATGIRIGEALVQGGAITWEQLEAALHVQAQVRASRAS